MSSTHDHPFFQVPRTQVTTSYGEFEQPALYYDVSTLMALFTTDYDRAAAKLVDLDLKPGLMWRGKAVVGLAFYEYRDTSIGPYNEVGLAIPALARHQSLPLGGWLDLWSNVNTRRLGHHILDLPVTTEIACAGGREFYGYPKFVTEIPFHLDSHSFHSEVLDPGRRAPIMSLSGKLGGGIPAPPMDLVLYSVLNGTRLRTIVNVRGSQRMRGKGELRLCVGDSEHGMARNLRDLGLHDQQPFLVTDTHRFQSRLNAGQEFDWAKH